MNQNGENKNNDWSTKTILIVEDNRANYFLLSEILEETRIKILWAKSGDESINYCKEEISVDIILMDYKMPNITGIETIKYLYEINPAYKIIGMSTNAYEQKFLNSGAIDFIRIPINTELLIQKLSLHLFND